MIQGCSRASRALENSPRNTKPAEDCQSNHQAGSHTRAAGLISLCPPVSCSASIIRTKRSDPLHKKCSHPFVRESDWVGCSTQDSSKSGVSENLCNNSSLDLSSVISICWSPMPTSDSTDPNVHPILPLGHLKVNRGKMSFHHELLRGTARFSPSQNLGF